MQLRISFAAGAVARGFLMVTLLFALSACGVKGKIHKPADATWPRTYPSA